MSSIFFTSERHRHDFLSAVQGLRKIYDGKLDCEYGAALYILTADEVTWNRVSDYVETDGIQFETMLEDVEFSDAYRDGLIKLAGNLFNGNTACSPVDFYRLDERNFKVALTALQVRRESLQLSAL